MKILHLTLKKKWFDMIRSGIKKEEYREIKPYWRKRLLHSKFDAIHFRNGYGRAVPSFTIELTGLYRSLGIVKWGAPEGEEVFILRLGEIITSHSSGTEHPVR